MYTNPKMELQLLVLLCSFSWEWQQNAKEGDTTNVAKNQIFLRRIRLVVSRDLVKVVRKPNGTEMFNTCLEDSLGIVTEERRDCQLGRF